ncbi:MAG: HAD-IIIA family hydrolase [Melioribacteraceae bacterium]|nr:HAD-IIIA family hydrolase [Melioribacteraceae bacterium]MCF8356457.1 HAD-IIIA family hydrolase [Melioribacteraceae bacterium]MCF8395845.1 HAD-IIIA family hydrolase [Melioribacteraceae bacterium]MCF8420929.1 HAD-IIIA family hydrolase [Melioribacteraceae bacterium]
MVKGTKVINSTVIKKAERIKLLLTDCDGVLTDTGVYYSANGEELKRFSIRDGMGVERLRKYAGVDTGIITGENSEIVIRRSEKLNISLLYLGIKNKVKTVMGIAEYRKLKYDEIAFIGDDSNDVEVMKLVGLSACPADATIFATETADFKTSSRGGNGAFRDFAELIITAKLNVKKEKE